MDVKISGRIDDLFWVQGSGETFYAKYQMAGTEIKDYLFWVHGNITARWNRQQEQRHKSTFGRFIHFDIFRKLGFKVIL